MPLPQLKNFRIQNFNVLSSSSLKLLQVTLNKTHASENKDKTAKLVCKMWCFSYQQLHFTSSNFLVTDYLLVDIDLMLILLLLLLLVIVVLLVCLLSMYIIHIETWSKYLWAGEQGQDIQLQLFSDIIKDNKIKNAKLGITKK